jgi:hypothetical protein
VLTSCGLKATVGASIGGRVLASIAAIEALGCKVAPPEVIFIL